MKKIRKNFFIRNFKNSEYDDICSVCDLILRKAHYSLDLVSVGMLNVLNEHPETLRRYFKKNTSWIFSLIFFFGNFFKYFCVSLFIDLRKNWYISSPIKESIEILFISHLLHKSHLLDDEDFYFGSRPQLIGKKRCAVLQRVHININAREAAHQTSQMAINKIFFASVSTTKVEFLIAVNQLSAFIKLYIIKLQNRHANLPRVLNEIACDALSGATTLNLRFYYQLKVILREIKPQAIFFTYEGHAWERLAIAAARESNLQICCKAYQHAILFPKQHSIFSSFGYRYDPDEVYFSGEVTKNIFFKKSKYHLPHKILGTHRHTPLANHLDKNLVARGTILVVPDGTLSECLYMLEFSLSAAIAMPKIRFILRFHPVQLELINGLSESVNLCPNLELSTRGLHQDFALSSWVLYRGSGAGVRAASAGIRPLYLNKNNEELSIDPLYELNDWKKVIYSVEDLSITIQKDQCTSFSDINTEYLKSKPYLSEYFMPTVINIAKNDLKIKHE